MLAFPAFNRRLNILLLAQALAGPGSAIVFLISGFVGADLAPIKERATLPMSSFVIGVALGSPLAPYAMAAWGRNNGHRAGIIVSLLGAILAGFALHFWSFSAYSAFCITGLLWCFWELAGIFYSWLEVL